MPDHDHSHGHVHGHSHGHAHGNERRLLFAAAIIGGFMLAEVAGGIASGSLALLADAGHMVTDFISLALAFMATRLARKPADGVRTYGYGRLQVLAAFVNGIALFPIAIWIVVEAWHRISSPQPVAGTMLFVIAAIGLAVNVVTFFMLHGSDDKDVNIRAAAAHVAGDLLGSVAAIAAGIVIMTTGWTPIDPLLSVVVAAIIAYSGYKVTKDAGHVLLEAARLEAAAFPTRASLWTAWETTQQAHGSYLAGATDGDMARVLEFDMPHRGGWKRHPAWQILAHVVNHGTDHRAQILATLHMLGAPTTEQDLMFYWWSR